MKSKRTFILGLLATAAVLAVSMATVEARRAKVALAPLPIIEIVTPTPVSPS